MTKVDSTLTPREWNFIFDLVKHEKFLPQEFGRSQEEENTGYNIHTISVLTHLPTRSFFRFRPHAITYCPGERMKTDIEEHLNRTWEYTRPFVVKWLHRVRLEHDAPDLWAMALEDRNFLQLTSAIDASNTPFSSDEQRYISAKLDEMRNLLLETKELQEEQRDLINAQFEYAKEASKRCGRLDWKNVLVSVLINVAINVATGALYAPERARELLQMAATAFMGLFTTVFRLGP